MPIGQVEVTPGQLAFMSMIISFASLCLALVSIGNLKAITEKYALVEKR